MGDDQPVRGFDLDTGALTDDLRALADAIDDGDAYVVGTETRETTADAGSAVEHELSVRVIPAGTLVDRLNFEYQTEADE